MEKLRVLYAEDDPRDADLTKAHFELEAPQIELEVVGSGQECLARLDEAQPDGWYCSIENAGGERRLAAGSIGDRRGR